MQTFVALYAPTHAGQTDAKPFVVSITADRIGAAARQALAIETRLSGMSLRAVWWDSGQARPARASSKRKAAALS